MSILGSILCAICIYVSPKTLNYIEKPIYGPIQETSDATGWRVSVSIIAQMLRP